MIAISAPFRGRAAESLAGFGVRPGRRGKLIESLHKPDRDLPKTGHVLAEHFPIAVLQIQLGFGKEVRRAREGDAEALFGEGG